MKKMSLERNFSEDYHFSKLKNLFEFFLKKMI